MNEPTIINADHGTGVNGKKTQIEYIVTYVRTGYHTVTARSGEEALRKARRELRLGASSRVTHVEPNVAPVNS